MDERSWQDPSTPLAHAGWLRALARELVADEHLAEDLAQDTWVAALEHARRGASPSRGWLATVLRNFLRQAARGGGHRRSRESVAARPEAVAATDQVVADLEAHRRLIEAVGELDEPYREVIVMRFLRGLSPREIGRELGLPAAAVSNRITVGLRRLRRRLERECGDRSSWTSLLAPLVLRSDPPLVPLGVLAVNSKLVVLASLTLAGTVAWMLWDPADEPRAAGAETAIAAARTRDVSGMPTRGEAPQRSAAPDRRLLDAPAAASEPSAAPLDAARFAIRGRVFDASGGALPGVRVAPLGADESEAATSGPGGWFELTRGSPQAEIVSADPRWLTVFAGAFRAQAQAAPVVVVATAIAVEGRVVDLAGNGLEHAQVSVVPPSGFETRFGASLEGSRALGWRADSDGDGAFRFSRAPAIDGARLRVVLDGYEPREEPAPVADAYGVELVLERPRTPASGSVAGVVVDELRRPIESARVALGLATALTDAAGEFRIDLRRAATSETLRAVKPGYRPAVLERPFDERPGVGGWPARVEVVLAEGTLGISGRVLRDDGEPVANARVSLADATPFGVIGMMPVSLEALAGGAAVPPEAIESARQLPDEDGSRSWTYRNRPPALPTAIWSFVRTDAEGRFEIEGLCARTYRLKVLDEATLLQVTSEPIDSGAQGVVIEVPSAVRWPIVSGRVVGPDGRGVAQVGLTLHVEAHRATSRVWGGTVSVAMVQPRESILTDAEGLFELRDVPAGELSLEVEGGAVVPTEFALHAVSDPRKVEIPVDLRCGLEVVVVDPADRADALGALDGDGRPIDLLRIRDLSVTAMTDLPLVDGRSGVVSVSSRARTLVLSKGGVEVARVPVRLSASETTQVRW